MAAQASDQQSRTDTLFDTDVEYWREIYSATSVHGIIYRDREQKVLDLIRSLKLPSYARILEIGSGSGRLSIALADLGYRIEATDRSSGMLGQIQREVTSAGVSDRVSIRQADINALPYSERSFNLVVAVGVFPWIQYPHRALSELRRVLVPGGLIVLTADNRHRIIDLVDPIRSPSLQSTRKFLKQILRTIQGDTTRAHEVSYKKHSISEFSSLLNSNGFKKLHDFTVGFGPFSLFGRELLSASIGRTIHTTLQRFADAGASLVRSSGSHYVVLARKVEMFTAQQVVSCNTQHLREELYEPRIRARAST